MLHHEKIIPSNNITLEIPDSYKKPLLPEEIEPIKQKDILMRTAVQALQRNTRMIVRAKENQKKRPFISSGVTNKRATCKNRKRFKSKNSNVFTPGRKKEKRKVMRRCY